MPSKILMAIFLVFGLLINIAPAAELSKFAKFNKPAQLNKYLAESLRENIRPYNFFEILSKTKTASFYFYESLFRPKTVSNPSCFIQGVDYSPKPVPTGRSFPTAVCYNPAWPEAGPPGCLNLCFIGAIWDPTTGMCGCSY